MTTVSSSGFWPIACSIRLRALPDSVEVLIAWLLSVLVIPAPMKAAAMIRTQTPSVIKGCFAAALAALSGEKYFIIGGAFPN